MANGSTDTDLTMMPRLATMHDHDAISARIAESVRGLSVGFYTEAQVEAALVAVFGVDTQLIVDGTYYVIDGASTSMPAAAGGWSRRRTLYGGDQTTRLGMLSLLPVKK